MQTITSREVQNRYGDFVESVQDDLVCVTRHGRPLFWAISDRHVRNDDSSVLIARILLLHGQLNPFHGNLPGDDSRKLLDSVECTAATEGLTDNDVMAIVHENRL